MAVLGVGGPHGSLAGSGGTWQLSGAKEGHMVVVGGGGRTAVCGGGGCTAVCGAGGSRTAAFERADHVAPAVRKWQETHASAQLAFSFLCSAPAHGMMPAKFRTGLSSSVSTH